MGKLRPVAATATKVGEIGTGSEKKDILKLEVSDGEDIDTLNRAGRTGEEITTGKEEKITGERYGKTNKTYRGDEMDESDVTKIVTDIMNKMQMNTNVESIKVVGEQTENRLKEVDQKLTGLDNRMKEWFDKTEEKQEESCTGISCVKKELAEIKEQAFPKLNQIAEELSNQEHEYATCSGPKGCNSKIPVGASFCPNCGLKIRKWPGHSEWTPYWERNK